MIRNSFQDLELSALGFGAMRLPTLPDGSIDRDAVFAMVDHALAQGINYFDTAAPYHDGHSEEVLGEALARHPRGSWYLADKYPGHQHFDVFDPAGMFEKQLKKCGVDYFDFYLFHNVCENSMADYMNPRWGILEYFVEQRRAGRIRHLGLSTHITADNLEALLDGPYGQAVEFVQIQLNYLDWDNPVIASGRLHEILSSRGVPMIIMEPVKGGTLAAPPPEALDKFNAARPGASAASWALRFVASQSGVMTILSGMSTEDQMADNINTFTHFVPLSDAEKQVIEDVKSIMQGKPTIGCTACRYCTDGCPQGIRIPDIFSLINAIRIYNEGWRAKNFYNSHIASAARASDCIGCGQCEGVCPQHLPIIELLKDASAQLDT